LPALGGMQTNVAQSVEILLQKSSVPVMPARSGVIVGEA
jgi:hypothetical protein